MEIEFNKAAFLDLVNQLQLMESLGAPEEPLKLLDTTQQNLYISIKNQSFLRDLILEISSNLTSTQGKAEKRNYLRDMDFILSTFPTRHESTQWDEIVKKLQYLTDKRSIHYNSNPTWDNLNIPELLNFEICDQDGIAVYKEIFIFLKSELLHEAKRNISSLLASFESYTESLGINHAPFNTTKKIKWKGSLKQLAELTVQLEAKGYIEFDVFGELKSNVKALASFYDLSHTKKDSDSNSIESLYKLFNSKTPPSELKYIINPEELLEKKYPEIFTRRGKKAFSRILKKKP